MNEEKRNELSGEANLTDLLCDGVKKYPCAKCKKLRSKDEGGEIFTVCDDCWGDE